MARRRSQLDRCDKHVSTRHTACLACSVERGVLVSRYSDWIFIPDIPCSTPLIGRVRSPIHVFNDAFRTKYSVVRNALYDFIACAE